MEQVNTREIVYEMLLRVIREQKPSHIVLADTLKVYAYLEKRDRAFITRLFRSVLERQIYLDYVIGSFSKTPLAKMNPNILILLEMGACQILCMDHVPDSAACNETVTLAKKHHLGNLAGFVNGVLRSIARGGRETALPDRDEDPVRYLSVCCSLPEWLAKMWIEDYGLENAEMMGKSGLQTAHLTVRVRTAFQNALPGAHGTGLSSMLAEFEKEGVEVANSQFITDAINLARFDRLEDITAFRDGRLIVQDESTMLAARCSGVKGTDKVIDLCAAPGGKTIHVADLMNADYRKIIRRGNICREGMVFARDISEAKADKIRENLRRVRLRNVKVQVQDALVAVPEDIGSCDLVMADLPCSGLGVLSRKPDIKRNMTREKIGELAALQRKMLANAAGYLKSGGTLIYSTCTVSKEENEENMRWLLENFPVRLDSIDEYIPFELHTETTKEGYLQVLPGQYGTDGFFVARMVKL